MDLRKEERVLLGFLKAGGDPVLVDGIEHLTTSDWENMLNQSFRHYLTPLFYHRLKRAGLKRYIPDEILRVLSETYLRNTARNVRLFHELSKVLKILKDAHIPVIVLKGGYLAEVVYGSIGIRILNDVDLLFKKKDLSTCQKILMDTGYYPYSRRLPLDIHWDIDLTITPLSIDTEEVWERAQPSVVAGVEVMALCPEDLLLHLCVHLAFHHLFQFAGLRSLCDVTETIRHYNGQMKWGQIQQRATRWGAGNAVYLSLLFARDLLNAEVPEGSLEALKPDNFDLCVKNWATERILYPAGAIDPLSLYFWQLWNPGPFRKKVANLMKLIFPSLQFISQTYPAPHGSLKNYLYYFIRIKEHLSKYGRAMWGILTHDEQMAMLAERENQNIAMREWLSST